MKYGTPKMELFVIIVCITVMAAWLYIAFYILASLNVPDWLSVITSLAVFYLSANACFVLHEMLRAAQRTEELEEKIERYFSGNKYDLY